MSLETGSAAKRQAPAARWQAEPESYRRLAVRPSAERSQPAWPKRRWAKQVLVSLVCGSCCTARQPWWQAPLV